MKVLAHLLLLCGIALCLVSCGGGPSSQNNQTAQVRLLQASGDLGNVDVQINGQIIASNIGWRQTFPLHSASYISVQPGTIHYQEFATGTTSPALVDTQLALSANTFYTIITAGEESTSSVGTILLTDDHVAPASGQLRIRFVNAASTIGSVDLAFASGPSNGPSAVTLGYQSSTSYLTFSGTSVQMCASWGNGLSGPGLPGVGVCQMRIGLNFQSPPQNSGTYVLIDPPSIPPNSSQGGGAGFTLSAPMLAGLPF